MPLLPIHGDCRCGKQSDAEKETRYIFCLIVAPWADDVACDRPCNDRIVFSIWKARRVIPMPCRRYCHIPDDIQMLFPVGVSKALLKTKALFMTYYYVLVLCSDGLLSLYLAAVYTCQPLKYVTIMGSNKLSANVFFLSLLFRFLFLPFLCWWARCLCLDLEFIFVSEPERESDRVYWSSAFPFFCLRSFAVGPEIPPQEKRDTIKNDRPHHSSRRIFLKKGLVI